MSGDSMWGKFSELCKYIRVPAAIIGMSMALAGCGPAQPVRPNYSSGELDLMANVWVVEGRFKIIGFCSAKGAKDSKYPSCSSGWLRFYAENYEPAPDMVSIVCPRLDRHSPEAAHRLDPCDYGNLYTEKFFSNFGTNDPGSTLRRMTLDVDRFRSLARQSLPEAERLKVISDERAYRALYPERLAKKNLEIERDNQAVEAKIAERDARRRAAADRARARFEAASIAPKQLGQTVCSSDNRVAQIENISGGNVQLSMRGRALGRRLMDDIRGPFTFGGPWTGDLAARLSGDIVADPNFLFQGFTELNFAPASGLIWDDSRYWGVCDYRLS